MSDESLEAFEYIVAACSPYFIYKLFERYSFTEDGELYSGFENVQYLPLYFRFIFALALIALMVHAAMTAWSHIRPDKSVSTEVDDELRRLRENRQRTKET